MNCNVFQQIVRENPEYNGPAVTDRDKTFSYPELFRDVREFAGILTENGVIASAKVGILAEDSYELMVATLAVLSLGAAAVPLSTRAAEAERLAMPEEVGLDFVLAETAYAAGGKEIRNPKSFRRIFHLERRLTEITPVPLPDSETPAFLRFSSGTTGGSKGVILTHRAVLERTDSCPALEIGRGECVPWMLDMAYHFVVTILLFLRRGAHIVIVPAPVEQTLAQVLKEYPPVLLYATPYHYRLMNHSAEIPKELLSRVECAVSTAMKLESSDAEQFREKFGIPLTQAYGIIEIGLPCINRCGLREKTNSVGKVQPAYQIRIFEPGADGAGEIGFRGPGMFDAYLKPFRLRKEFCRDGYFLTGDIGRLDEEGYLYLTGRSKNVINFAGMKIFPYEVESVLLKNPMVQEALVTGKSWPGVGEIPVVRFVPNGPLPEDWLDQLRRYCFARLAPHKVPKEFLPVEKLPKTASGKLIRSAQ